MGTDRTLLGISCLVVGMATGSLMDALVKSISDTYPLHEIVLVRSVVAIALTLIFVYFEGGFGILKTKRPFIHLLRGILIVIANMSFYMGITIMPIAEATALFFVSPLIITALSVPFLGESVGWRRWLGIFIGFIGVIIMIRPDIYNFDYYSLLPLVGATAYAITQITSRKISGTEKASVMSFYISVTFLIVSLGFWSTIGDGVLSGQVNPKLEFLVRAWVMPDYDDSILMIINGVLIAIVGYMLSQAYRIADASAIAPFEYVTLPLALMWGYLFWREVPDIQAAFGMCLIVGSGLFIFLRENRSEGIVNETYGVDSSEDYLPPKN